MQSNNQPTRSVRPRCCISNAPCLLPLRLRYLPSRMVTAVSSARAVSPGHYTSSKCMLIMVNLHDADPSASVRPPMQQIGCLLIRPFQLQRRKRARWAPCSVPSHPSVPPLGAEEGLAFRTRWGRFRHYFARLTFQGELRCPFERDGWHARMSGAGGSVSFLLFCRFPIRSVACFPTSSESERAGNSFAARGRRRFSPSLNPSQGLEAGFVLCPLLLRPSLPNTPVQCPSNSRNYQGVSMSELLSLKK